MQSQRIPFAPDTQFAETRQSISRSDCMWIAGTSRLTQDRRENIPFRDDPGRKKMPQKMEKLAKIFGRFFCVFFEFLLGRRWWAVVFFWKKRQKNHCEAPFPAVLGSLRESIPRMTRRGNTLCPKTIAFSGSMMHNAAARMVPNCVFLQMRRDGNLPGNPQGTRLRARCACQNRFSFRL